MTERRWHYADRPDPLFPWKQKVRDVAPCPLCGAPLGAFCVRMRGSLNFTSDVHKARSEQARRLGTVP